MNISEGKGLETGAGAMQNTGKAATDCDHVKPKMVVFGSPQCNCFPCVPKQTRSLKFAVCYLTEHRFGRNEEQFASFWRRKIKQPIRIVKHALQHTLGDRPMTGIADEVGSVFVLAGLLNGTFMRTILCSTPRHYPEKPHCGYLAASFRQLTQYR